ncbi:MAG TPA: hypothetical protein PLW02_01080 [Verrucomicrobiota bacterium]|nr:hypothetical protein [Verrucomicrobiota bacterium]
MKKTLAFIVGLALTGSAILTLAQQSPPNSTSQSPQGLYCKKGDKTNDQLNDKNQGQGQQNRFGWGMGRKGFRCGPQDGTGPRRDGSCGRCPRLS